MSTQPLLPAHTSTTSRLNARRLPPPSSSTSNHHQPIRTASTKGRDKGKGKAVDVDAYDVDHGSGSSDDDDESRQRTRTRLTRSVKGKGTSRVGTGGAFISYASDSSSGSSHSHHNTNQHQHLNKSTSLPTTLLHEPEDQSEQPEEEQGRCVTFRFTGTTVTEGQGQEPDLDVWVEQGESVGSVKEKIRTLRPSLAAHSLRFIHSGRLLTDGILLLPWLRSLETRLTRQAEGLGGVIRGLAEEGEEAVVGIGLGHDPAAGAGALSGKGKQREEKVWLHCVVGGVVKESITAQEVAQDEEDSPLPTRRGFDSLLDAGFTPTEIAAMRREFYLSRGEEVPDEFLSSAADGGGGGAGATRDAGYEEHVRALEEQWIEGGLNNETAQTVNEGLYSSILHGLLIGFLYPLIPWFFFRDLPSPNFFDPLEPPDAPAPSPSQHRRGAHPVGASESPTPHASPPPPPLQPADDATTTAATSVFGLRGLPGGDWRTGVVFGQRTQMAILIGTVLNVGFAGIRFLA